MVTPVPPANSPYGLESLNLVQSFAGKDGRSQYRDYNDGEQAPAFVTNDGQGEPVPIKRWYITSDKPLNAGFFNASGVWQSRIYSPEFLSFLNLPGTFEYPMQKSTPSGAYMLIGDAKQYIPSDSLSGFQDARILQTELAAAGYQTEMPYETVMTGMYKVYFDLTERRRMWNIKIGEGSGVVSSLLRAKYAFGVGAPGKWSSPADSSYPSWIAAIPLTATQWNVMPEEPVPQRQLGLSERMKIGPFGIQIFQAGDSFQEASATNQDIMRALKQLVAAAGNAGNVVGVGKTDDALMASLARNEKILRRIANSWSVDISNL